MIMLSQPLNQLFGCMHHAAGLSSSKYLVVAAAVAVAAVYVGAAERPTGVFVVVETPRAVESLSPPTFYPQTRLLLRLLSLLSPPAVVEAPGAVVESTTSWLLLRPLSLV